MKVIGQSTKFQEILRTVELVSVTNVPILLSGEMGTGKNLLALKIHQQSQHKARQFMRVNCSTLGKNSAKITQARSGTLFLDNVSALSNDLQIRLLHFIEAGDVQTADVRLIVATDKNLHDEVTAGNFRSDLFYRLNIIPVELPPLKEREGDVSLLIEHFFRQAVQEHHQPAPSFSKLALKQIVQYDWPGNIRELHNFCERMFIFFRGKEVDVTNLPHELRSFTSSKINPDSPFSLPPAGIKLEQVEVDLMQQALQSSNGNKSRAARLLGLTRDTFLYRLKKYSID